MIVYVLVEAWLWLVMGMCWSLPKALVVMRTPGGIWRRFCSAPSTSRRNMVDHERIEALRHEIGRGAVVST